MLPVFDSPDSFLASFVSGQESGSLMLLTGSSGLGKTRWCHALARSAPAYGLEPAGLLSPPVYQGESKVGIDLLDLRSGERRRLAVRPGKNTPGLQMKTWVLDETALAWGNEVLARIGECPLLIIDELGPSELLQGIGLTAALPLIAARRYRLACVVVRPHLLDEACRRWPWARACLPAREGLA